MLSADSVQTVFTIRAEEKMNEKAKSKFIDSSKAIKGHHVKTALTCAVLLSLSTGTAHAQAAAKQKKELEELRKQVQELVNQSKAKSANDAKEIEALKKQVEEL